MLTTFDDMVALILKKDWHNKDEKDVPSNSAFASFAEWKASKKVQCCFFRQFGHKEAMCFNKKEQEQKAHHANSIGVDEDLEDSKAEEEDLAVDLVEEKLDCEMKDVWTF